MNGNLRSVPDIATTQMTKELTERAQDKQAAVAMRAQDLQVGSNKAEIATRLLVSDSDKVGDDLKGTLNQYLVEYFENTTVTDPLASLPDGVMVRV